MCVCVKFGGSRTVCVCVPKDIMAMASVDGVVAERPEAIYIGTDEKLRKGADYVWRYELMWVGDERIYVCWMPPSTSFQGDMMFIVSEKIDDKIWHVAYEGRAVEQELEERSPVFRTLEPFWEAGEHDWETNAAGSRVSYKAAWVEPQWKANGWRARTVRAG